MATRHLTEGLNPDTAGLKFAGQNVVVARAGGPMPWPNSSLSPKAIALHRWDRLVGEPITIPRSEEGFVVRPPAPHPTPQSLPPPRTRFRAARDDGPRPSRRAADPKADWDSSLLRLTALDLRGHRNPFPHSCGWCIPCGDERLRRKVHHRSA